MASGLFAAARSAMVAFGGTRRNPGPPLDPSAVNWGHALAGVALLVVVTVVGIVAPVGSAVVEFLPQLFEILLVAALTLAVPYIVVVAAAAWTSQREKLPLLVLYTSLSLLLINLTSLALSFVGLSSSSALIGVTAVFIGRAARKALDFPVGLSIVVGLITAVGIFAASLVLFTLPSGQAMLAGSA